MENEFQEELKNNQFKAWFGYIRRFSMHCCFVFKHIGKGQRGVRCKECGVKISKEVPRIFISGSWYYYTGHYCLRCALKKIKEDISVKEELAEFLKVNLADLYKMTEILSKTIDKERYKDIMAIHILNSKLEPKKEY